LVMFIFVQVVKLQKTLFTFIFRFRFIFHIMFNRGKFNVKMSTTPLAEILACWLVLVEFYFVKIIKCLFTS